jgi:hypothetical protein
MDIDPLMYIDSNIYIYILIIYIYKYYMCV